MNSDVFPNTIDAWGPNGMVFYRNVQIRWTPYRTDSNQFAIAIERPGNDIDAGQIQQFDPQLGDNIQSDQKLPDLTAHWHTVGDWGHFQVAGILRDVAYDTKDTKNNEPKGSQTGWGVNLSGTINTIGKDKLLQAVHGQGIASYIADGGTDLAPEGRLPTDTEPGNAHAKAVLLTGIVAYYDHSWNDEFSTSFGYSTTFVNNTNLQEDSVRIPRHAVESWPDMPWNPQPSSSSDP